ncbi:hypothetical protein M9434_002134 [Picochlorum sp. BPE23]|nr:hypothetical protein M9434_002134 [Picochlorum sp. BPE23]
MNTNSITQHDVVDWLRKHGHLETAQLLEYSTQQIAPGGVYCASRETNMTSGGTSPRIVASGYSMSRPISPSSGYWEQQQLQQQQQEGDDGVGPSSDPTMGFIRVPLSARKYPRYSPRASIAASEEYYVRSPSQSSVATKSTCTTPRYDEGAIEIPALIGSSCGKGRQGVARPATAPLRLAPPVTPQSPSRGNGSDDVDASTHRSSMEGNANKHESSRRSIPSYSHMERYNGTAEWVYGRNPEGPSDVYKSLVTYLDRNSSQVELMDRSVSGNTDHPLISAEDEGDEERDKGEEVGDDEAQKVLDSLSPIRGGVTSAAEKTSEHVLSEAFEKSMHLTSDDWMSNLPNRNSLHPIHLRPSVAKNASKSPFDVLSSHETRETTSGDVFSFPVETAVLQQEETVAATLFGVGSWQTFHPGVSLSSPGSQNDFHVKDEYVGLGGEECPDTLQQETQMGGFGASVAFDEDKFHNEFEEIYLRVVHRRGRTGFECHRELPLQIDDVIAGRYQIVELLGQAVFSRAVQALDLKTGQHICLKVVKNDKDYFDQSLDEVKVLRHVNEQDPQDEHGIVRLYDFFYYKEHLILVTELLRANLYEFLKYDGENNETTYFSVERVKSIAMQLLQAVAFLHSLSLIHSDLKPENILVKSYSKCRIKVIDLGSTFFDTDARASVVQSRSYRAPEVILGAPYSYAIDIWSIGCVLVELVTGDILFHKSSGAQMLASMESILGKFPQSLLGVASNSKRYFLGDGRIFEYNTDKSVDVLKPKKSSLNSILDSFDPNMADFIGGLLRLDPEERFTAEEALRHPWLQH